jgi:hypothetical protein
MFWLPFLDLTTYYVPYIHLAVPQNYCTYTQCFDFELQALKTMKFAQANSSA